MRYDIQQINLVRLFCFGFRDDCKYELLSTIIASLSVVEAY